MSLRFYLGRELGNQRGNNPGADTNPPEDQEDAGEGPVACAATAGGRSRTGARDTGSRRYISGSSSGAPRTSASLASLLLSLGRDQKTFDRSSELLHPTRSAKAGASRTHREGNRERDARAMSDAPLNRSPPPSSQVGPCAFSETGLRPAP